MSSEIPTRIGHAILYVDMGKDLEKMHTLLTPIMEGGTIGTAPVEGGFPTMDIKYRAWQSLVCN